MSCLVCRSGRVTTHDQKEESHAKTRTRITHLLLSTGQMVDDNARFFTCARQCDQHSFVLPLRLYWSCRWKQARRRRVLVRSWLAQALLARSSVPLEHGASEESKRGGANTPPSARSDTPSVADTEKHLSSRALPCMLSHAAHVRSSHHHPPTSNTHSCITLRHHTRSPIDHVAG